LGPVPGVIGALQGSEAARICRGESPAFIGRLIQYDSPAMNLRAVAFKPNPSCRVCGPNALIRRLDPAEYPDPACLPV
jgi:adenylyltransferase/sulfurtransferase